MKTKTTIISLEHDDLVNLLSTAVYGSQWLSIRKRKADYYGTELENENDCAEDTWAKVLLSGKAVFAYDYYAEDADEHYGKLPYRYNGECMRYTLTLDDIVKGLQNALDNGDYMAECVMGLINEDIDLTIAENLMQWIIFGELVYG